MMSGSRNKFSRNGSTASRESGPPSWDSTIPTRFFPATLFPSRQSFLQPLDVFAQLGGASRHGDELSEEYAQANHVRGHTAAKILHTASASCASVCASARTCSSS